MTKTILSETSMNGKSNKDVYCDNERLKEFIVDAKPSKNGLYPHEIIMIKRTTFGKLKTVNTDFPGIFKYQYCVEFPLLLLKSLVDRGFIRETISAELVEFISLDDLRLLMKNKNLKCKGTASKDNTKSLIRDNYSPDEVYEFLKFQLYVPTEFGWQELEQNEDLINNAYEGWRLNSGHKKSKFIKPEEIKLTNISAFELHISKADFTCTINGQLISTWVHHLVAGTTISIYINGRKIWNEIPADTIYLMNNTKKIILARKKSNKTKNKMICTGYDIINEKINFTETITNNICSSFPIEEFKNFHELNSFEGVILNDKIRYFVSVNNILAIHILNDFFNETSTIEKMSNYFEDDDSLNYVISVGVKDDYLRNIIMYMIINNLLRPPSIKGVTLHEVLMYLRASKKNNTEITFIENATWNEELKCSIAQEIMHRCNQDWNEFYKNMIKIYPKRAFNYDMFRNYSSENGYNYDENRTEVYQNKKKWDKEYKILIERLMLSGKINPRWINEFALYSIVNEYFPESVYQFRDLWLERQSIDIFIPSLKIAIEYQGLQHYSAIEFFGGEESYKNRQMLDEKKRFLCEREGVQLIEWPYTREVSVSNFIETFKSNSIVLPKNVSV